MDLWNPSTQNVSESTDNVDVEKNVVGPPSAIDAIENDKVRQEFLDRLPRDV